MYTFLDINLHILACWQTCSFIRTLQSVTNQTPDRHMLYFEPLRLSQIRFLTDVFSISSPCVCHRSDFWQMYSQFRALASVTDQISDRCILIFDPLRLSQIRFLTDIFFIFHPWVCHCLYFRQINHWFWKRIRFCFSPEKYTLLDKHISGGIQNPNADPLALGSHASGTKLALKAR